MIIRIQIAARIWKSKKRMRMKMATQLREYKSYLKHSNKVTRQITE